MPIRLWRFRTLSYAQAAQACNQHPCDSGRARTTSLLPDPTGTGAKVHRAVAGEACLLVDRMNGVGARAVRAMKAEQEVGFASGWLERIWPGCRRLIKKTYTKDWGNSYAKGACSHYASGQIAGYARLIPKPVDRLYFAGEHTSLAEHGVEGALASGRRAAGEVIEELALA